MRTEKQKKDKEISDRSFIIYNENGTVYAEMEEGKWIVKPEESEE